MERQRHACGDRPQVLLTFDAPKLLETFGTDAFVSPINRRQCPPKAGATWTEHVDAIWHVACERMAVRNATSNAGRTLVPKHDPRPGASPRGNARCVKSGRFLRRRSIADYARTLRAPLGARDISIELRALASVEHPVVAHDAHNTMTDRANARERTDVERLCRPAVKPRGEECQLPPYRCWRRYHGRAMRGGVDRAPEYPRKFPKAGPPLGEISVSAANLASPISVSSSRCSISFNPLEALSRRRSRPREGDSP